MNLIGYICIMWLTTVVFPSADSQIILAQVGSTVILPCEWRSALVQTPHVQWSTVSEIVLERKGVQLYESEGYKNRVDVPEDKLFKGNCSLELKNVRLTDAGVYESYLSVMRKERSKSTKWLLLQSVELSVYETTEKTLQDISDTRETPGENFYERLTADGRVNCPGPQIILLTLLTCLCVFQY